MNRNTSANQVYKQIRWYAPQSSMIQSMQAALDGQGDVIPLPAYNRGEIVAARLIKPLVITACVLSLDILLLLTKCYPTAGLLALRCRDREIRTYGLSRFCGGLSILVFAAAVILSFPYTDLYRVHMNFHYQMLILARAFITVLLLTDLFVGGWPGRVGARSYFLYGGMLGAVYLYSRILGATDWNHSTVGEVGARLLQTVWLPLAASLATGLLFGLACRVNPRKLDSPPPAPE